MQKLSLQATSQVDVVTAFKNAHVPLIIYQSGYAENCSFHITTAQDTLSRRLWDSLEQVDFYEQL
jgi:hypothetical protein